jgi:2-oxoglutarate/2-oxoacid ferredoxin oxidoreductase subunit beta
MIDYMPFLREQKFPHIWCPGCGHGIVMKAILRAVDKMGWANDEVVMVSGIGCSSRMPGYVDFNTLHTTHGRAIAFATGVKMVNPRLNVVVITGDGDAAAIGGNHFIHAARRNIDLTVVVMNNFIYGMTGGQVSPTTPIGKRASTAPYGNFEPPFDISNLAVAAGASFVARGTAYNAVQLGRFVERAMTKKGFAVVEAMSPCPTVYGRRNKYRRGVVEMLEELRDQSISQKEADKLTAEERQGRIVTGVFVDAERQEYTAQYERLIESLRA